MGQLQPNQQVKKWKLSAFWEEVTRPVVEVPGLQGAVVRKFDANGLVLDNNAQVDLGIGVVLVGQLFGLAFLPFMLASLVQSMLSRKHEEQDMLFQSLAAIALLAGICLLCASLWVCYAALIQPRPSATVFDRRSQKVYGSHRGKPVVLDWSQVRPVLTRATNFQAGAQTHYYLVLMNFDLGQEGPLRKKTGYGIQVAYGGAWASGSCRMVWEYLRCYMEGGPDALPVTEVTPEGLNPKWVDTVLDSGPYAELTNDTNRLQRRRDNLGVPQISGWSTLLAVFAGPAVALNLWQMFMRPQVKLPAKWLPAPAVGVNPYKIIQTDANDVALRHKEAGRVAWWLAACTTAGCTFWGSVAWWVGRHI